MYTFTTSQLKHTNVVLFSIELTSYVNLPHILILSVIRIECIYLYFYQWSLPVELLVFFAQKRLPATQFNLISAKTGLTSPDKTSLTPRGILTNRRWQSRIHPKPG